LHLLDGNGKGVRVMRIRVYIYLIGELVVEAGLLAGWLPGPRLVDRAMPCQPTLKALCLVLVISDNVQVLIMCLRLYVAKDD
jgi:hypothetical protein